MPVPTTTDCSSGFPWVGVSADLAETVFATVRPQWQVSGTIGGGRHAPAGRMQPTHSLHYVVFQTRQPIARSADWLVRGENCGRQESEGGVSFTSYMVESQWNEFVPSYPKRVPARLLTKEDRGLYLEFSGSTWSRDDVRDATAKLAVLLTAKGPGQDT